MLTKRCLYSTTQYFKSNNLETLHKQEEDVERDKRVKEYQEVMVHSSTE